MMAVGQSSVVHACVPVLPCVRILSTASLLRFLSRVLAQTSQRISGSPNQFHTNTNVFQERWIEARHAISKKNIATAHNVGPAFVGFFSALPKLRRMLKECKLIELASLCNQVSTSLKMADAMGFTEHPEVQRVVNQYGGLTYGSDNNRREINRNGAKRITKILFHCNRETLHQPIECLDESEDIFPPRPPLPPLPPPSAPPQGDAAATDAGNDNSGGDVGGNDKRTSGHGDVQSGGRDRASGYGDGYDGADGETHGDKIADRRQWHQHKHVENDGYTHQSCEASSDVAATTRVHIHMFLTHGRAVTTNSALAVGLRGYLSAPARHSMHTFINRDSHFTSGLLDTMRSSVKIRELLCVTSVMLRSHISRRCTRSIFVR